MIEAMKQALEALQRCEGRSKSDEGDRHRAITSLRQAIANLERQEPVAHWSDCAVHSEPAYPKGKCNCGGYTHPPQRTWVGLTDEETIAIELGLRIPTGCRDIYDLSLRDFAIAIEAKLKEKNNA